MADKRYYWWKLQRDFFDSKRIKRLRSIPGGDVYTIIYLKMLLKAVDTEGVLIYEGVYDDFANELAADLCEDVDCVQITLSFLEKVGLLERNGDEYYLPECVENTGSESTSAIRVRKHRALQCNADVTEEKRISNTEKEKEKEIDKETDKNTCPKPPSAESEFEELWKLYPKKQGKKQALAAYKRARRDGATFDEVKEGIESYLKYIAESKTENRFIKMGSTFFSQNSWDDEWAADKKASGRNYDYVDLEKRLLNR